MIDSPKSNDDADRADSDLPNSHIFPNSGQPTESRENSKNPKQERRYAENIMRLLEAVKKHFSGLIRWLDDNNGAVTAIATVVIAGLTAAYVHYARAQWRTMQQQIGEMNTARRPWLGPAGPFIMKKPPSFDVVGILLGKPMVLMSIDYSVNLQNFGQSPALHESDTFFAYAKEDGSTPAEWELASPCEMSDTIAKNPVGSTIIFPGAPVTRANRSGSGLPFGNAIAFWVIGCVSYRDDADRIHHTRMLWTAILPSQLTPQVVVENPRTTWVPFTEFRLVDSRGD